MNLSIVLLDGENLTFQINKANCVIGRSPQCDVVITRDGMSRRHCMIENRDGDVFVTDLGSSNGVSIEGKKIPPNTPVRYQTYLSLSFGAVQSIDIEFEDLKEVLTKSDSFSPTVAPKKPDNVPPKNTKPKTNIHVPSKNEHQSKIVKIVAFIAIVGFLLFTMMKNNDSEAPTPEQMYE